MMDDYTQIYGEYTPPTRLEKTAKGLREWGHRFSMVPYLGGLLLAPAMTAIAMALDSVDGFFNKSFGSGVKSVVSGTVDTAVTSIVGATGSLLPTFWMPVNWVSGLATGESLSEHARKGTQDILSTFISDKPVLPKETELARRNQVLGAHPMTAGFSPAAIAYPALPQMQQAQTGHINPATGQSVPPNYWADREAKKRGQSPEEARANWVRNNYQDAVALRQASQGPAELGAS